MRRWVAGTAGQTGELLVGAGGGRERDSQLAHAMLAKKRVRCCLTTGVNTTPTVDWDSVQVFTQATTQIDAQAATAHVIIVSASHSKVFVLLWGGRRTIRSLCSLDQQAQQAEPDLTYPACLISPEGADTYY